MEKSCWPFFVDARLARVFFLENAMQNQQRPLTTEELAEQLRIRPQTLRAALCNNGTYFGVRPTKCPNGRLLWPTDAAQQVLQRDAA